MRLTVAIHQPRAGIAPEARLDQTAAAMDRAAARGADLIVFPELWYPGYGTGDEMAALAERSDGRFAGGLSRLAKAHRMSVCFGFAEREGDRVYNAALVMGPDGKPLARHRKRVLPSNYEKRLFDLGGAPCVFKLGSWCVGIVICYEVEFPETMRQAALGGADLVLAPTALGALWQVVADHLIPTRAFENGVFLAYADWAGAEPGQAYYGGSQIVGPDGRVLTRALRDGDLIVARLQRDAVARARARIPYLKDLPGLSG